MNERIFKAYDIRGIYPLEINDEVAAEVARGCSALFPGGKMIVGRDVRIGSSELAQAIVKNLLLNPKYEVIDVGICSTPLFYFAVNALGAAGGIMVTASHNPPEWNGFKVVGPKAVMIGGDAVKEAIRNAGPAGQGGGRYEKREMVEEYVSFYKQQFNVRKPLRVVCDFGNGATGRICSALVPVFENITFSFLNDVPDGRFPSRGPNPLIPGALDGLKKEVVKTGAELGVAFDADGDRAFFVDGHGDEIPYYVVAFLLAEQGKERLVAEVQTFHVLKHIGYKGELYESRVGTRFMKEKMKDVDADIGAEYSGHYYFREFFDTDSGIFAFMRLLQIISGLPSSFQEFLERIPRRETTQWDVRVEDPAESIRKISSIYEGKNELQKDTTDGVVFASRDWLFGMRPSNTEPLLRFWAGADSRETLEKLVREIQSNF